MALHHLPHIFHGPERVPLEPETLALRDPANARPIFGIAPLGWVAHRWDNPVEASRVWADHAGTFDAALLPGASPIDTALSPYLKVLRAAKTLPFTTAVAQAARAASKFASSEGLSADDVLSLWCIKEGQVSSVWHCRLSDGHKGFRSVAINVARDKVAAAHLANSAQVLSDCADGPVARVRAVFGTDEQDDTATVCTVQDWIADSRELGVWRDATSRRMDGLVAIERFLPDNHVPAGVAGVVAERLTDKHWRALIGAVGKLRHVGSDSIEIPDFTLSNGDFVLSPDGPCLVACSGRWTVLPGLKPDASKGAIRRKITAHLNDVTRECVAYTIAS
ncbi:MAG: hypothetical protein GKR99_15800 [Rhodobacteraceae bacterium]|nr:hypothetical protein [Paracoccaceae bacterium]